MSGALNVHVLNFLPHLCKQGIVCQLAFSVQDALAFASRFLFMAKGGGSANKTYLYQQTKAAQQSWAFSFSDGLHLYRHCSTRRSWRHSSRRSCPTVSFEFRRLCTRACCSTASSDTVAQADTGYQRLPSVPCGTGHRRYLCRSSRSGSRLSELVESNGRLACLLPFLPF